MPGSKRVNESQDVFRFDGQSYWPQAPVTFDQANHLWTSSVFVARAPNAAQTTILAAISADLGTLTDYYGQVHEYLMKERSLDLWVPIRFPAQDEMFAGVPEHGLN